MPHKKTLKSHLTHSKVVRGRRGISPIISTIIISGTLLIILVIASFVSANILELQIASTEFEQAKTNMILLDEVIQDVALRPGSGGYVQFNQRSGGIGIAETTETIKITAQCNQTSVTLRPNAAGAYSQWEVYPANLERWNVTSDENLRPNDETFIFTSSTSKNESQSLEDAIPRTASINYVSFYAWAKGNKNTMKLRLRTNNTDFENSTEFRLKNNFNLFEVRYSKNPYNGIAWTWEKINELEIGSRANSFGSADPVQIGAFYVIVDFKPPASANTIYNSSPSIVSFVYRGGTQTSAADVVMHGTSYVKVDLTQGLGFLRVEYDQGVKIKLDYDRVRIVSSGLVDEHTNLIEITFLRLSKGTFGGSGTVNVKIQNTNVAPTPQVFPSGIITIDIQWTSPSGISSGSFVFDPKDPNVTNTVVMFTTIWVQVSTA